MQAFHKNIDRGHPGLVRWVTIQLYHAFQQFLSCLHSVIHSQQGEAAHNDRPIWCVPIAREIKGVFDKIQ